MRALLFLISLCACTPQVVSFGFPTDLEAKTLVLALMDPEGPQVWVTAPDDPSPALWVHDRADLEIVAITYRESADALGFAPGPLVPATVNGEAAALPLPALRFWKRQGAQWAALEELPRALLAFRYERPMVQPCLLRGGCLLPVPEQRPMCQVPCPSQPTPELPRPPASPLSPQTWSVACPSGWVEPNGVCAPWSDAPCEPGEHRLVGQGCVRLGTTCAAFAPGLPSDAVYVFRSAPPGGDGSLARPLQSLAEAAALARPGATIALGPGEYAQTRLENLHLWGACVAETVLRGPVTLQDANLRNLTVTGEVEVGGAAFWEDIEFRSATVVAQDAELLGRQVVADSLRFSNCTTTLETSAVGQVALESGAAEFADTALGGLVANESHVGLRRVFVETTSVGLRLQGSQLDLSQVFQTGGEVGLQQTGGTIEGEDYVIRSVTLGISVLSATVSLARVVVAGHDRGIELGDSMSTFELLRVEDSAIRGLSSSNGQVTLQDATFSVAPPSQALALSVVGAVNLARVQVQGHGTGLLTHGRVDAQDVQIASISKVGGFGWYHHHGDLLAQRVAIIGTKYYGLALDFTDATIMDLTIEDITSESEEHGQGLRVIARSTLRLERARFIANQRAGLILSEGDHHLLDVEVAQTRPRPGGRGGGGLEVETGRAQLERIWLHSLTAFGLRSARLNATVLVNHLTIQDVAPAPCFPSTCGVMGSGAPLDGVAALADQQATLEMSDVLLERARVGLRIGVASDGTLRRAQVRDHSLALQIEPRGFDLARISEQVQLSGNQVLLLRPD